MAHSVITLHFRLLIFIFQIVLCFLHSTSVLSFYIDVVLTLSIIIIFDNPFLHFIVVTPIQIYAMDERLASTYIYIYILYIYIYIYIYIKVRLWQLLLPPPSILLLSMKGVSIISTPFLQIIKQSASYQIRKIVGCACAVNAGGVFHATNLKGNR